MNLAQATSRFKSTSQKLFAFCLAASCLLFAFPAAASNETVLYDFPGHPGGMKPYTGVVFDKSGNLFGVTSAGGPNFEGDVYELSPNGDGAWNYTEIYTFSCGAEGCYPSGLAFDDSGNLYVSTSVGGTSNRGTILEMTTDSARAWSATVLYSFGSDTSKDPQSGGGLVWFNGALYGVASGGTDQGGVVFSLTKTSAGDWVEATLHNFESGNDPSSIIVNTSGVILGTTSGSGPGGAGAGTVFELKQDETGTWKNRALHTFTAAEGIGPYSLVSDNAGNLYGTTAVGGPGEYGTVFELSKSSSTWTLSTLHAFSGGLDGAAPNGISLDSQGRVYGTTFQGGGRGVCENPPSSQNEYCGTAFLLTPTHSGTWHETFLHRFAGEKDGGEPAAGLVVDANDNSYGTASEGGTTPYGLVFMLNAPGK
jgi:uncharacterized repeat protein (TIGR03803 family)